MILAAGCEPPARRDANKASDKQRHILGPQQNNLADCPGPLCGACVAQQALKISSSVQETDWRFLSPTESKQIASKQCLVQAPWTHPPTYCSISQVCLLDEFKVKSTVKTLIMTVVLPFRCPGKLDPAGGLKSAGLQLWGNVRCEPRVRPKPVGTSWKIQISKRRRLCALLGGSSSSSDAPKPPFLLHWRLNNLWNSQGTIAAMGMLRACDVCTGYPTVSLYATTIWEQQQSKLIRVSATFIFSYQS
ncbi:hypothetical protein H671_3g10917 [Cricetulus griseus]|nr:hypothetical protein H671_3g10917 [Cricetulus griseus]